MDTLYVVNGADLYIVDRYREHLTSAAPNGPLEVDICEHGEKAHQDQRPALAIAAENGHLEVVTLLCQLGADVNLENAVSWIPLISIAAGAGHLDVIMFLCEHGSDVNEAGVKGWTLCYMRTLNWKGSRPTSVTTRRPRHPVTLKQPGYFVNLVQVSTRQTMQGRHHWSTP